MRHPAVVVPLLLLSGAALSSPTLPLAAPNYNETTAGTLSADTLTLHLVASMAQWKPEEDSGGTLDVALFGEDGKDPSDPGPMIRVPAGTIIHATIRNALDSTLVLHGFDSRPGGTADTLALAPGATREVSFAAGDAGTYFYWGSITGAATTVQRRGVESQLNGAFIVDPAGGSPPDRVMLISVWIDTLDIGGRRFEQEVATINGRDFGHRPWLDYTVGDSVRWRVINASDRSHPMHLHGFFFRVDSRGDLERDTTYSHDQQRLGTTEFLEPGTTMRLGWRPDRPGDWIFHCHIAYHITWGDHLPRTSADTLPPAWMAMTGMVVGLHIHAPPGYRSPVAQRTDTERVRLLVQQKPNFWYDSLVGMGYVVQNGPAPAPDSVVTPGMPIVLTRGRPAEITIVNHLSEPTAVHWHAIELTSYYDGVAGVSGSAKHRAPRIMPGDSFTAYILPPRAGSFMYHTHLDDLHQLFSGLTGSVVVLDSGQTWDPSTDHIIYFTAVHDVDSIGSVLMNGSKSPPPLQVAAGVPQRFRFMSLTAAGAPRYRIIGSDSTPVMWTPVNKDGADLPSWQRVPTNRGVIVAVGETADRSWTPAHPGVYRLQMLLPHKDVVMREMEIVAR